jgi:hypothetical protein
MDIEKDWTQIKKICKSSFRSSLHFSIASVDKNGNPHQSPIGSLILGKPGKAIYFELFSKNLARNIQTNNHICILAVNSSKWFWLKSLLLGRFVEMPAIRLKGTAGISREVSDEEAALWHKRVKSLAFTKGHGILWSKVSNVREVDLTACEVVQAGGMTKNMRQE